MAYDDDVADAESLGDDEYEDQYDDQYDDEDEEEEYLFGTIPRTPGLIAIAAVGVVILLLLAALVSSSFGFVGGIDGLTVNIPGSQGDILDEKLEVEALTDTPAFGKNADGNGDLKIYYDSEVIISQSIKFNEGRGYREIPYADFYIDNGEYKVEVTFEGFTEFDTIDLFRTAHNIVIAQADYPQYVDEDETLEKVRYKISLLPDDNSDDLHNIIFTPGTGYILVYYVNDEADQDNRDEYEQVMNISFETDFRGFEYKFPGEDLENLSVDKGYLIDFDGQVLLDEKGVDEGYFSMEAFFVNTYGISEKRFTQQIKGMPEENSSESHTWIYLGDE
jgi:hypothetical protein